MIIKNKQKIYVTINIDKNHRRKHKENFVNFHFF
jgi:hypothetical protein